MKDRATLLHMVEPLLDVLEEYDWCLQQQGTGSDKVATALASLIDSMEKPND